MSLGLSIGLEFFLGQDSLAPFFIQIENERRIGGISMFSSRSNLKIVMGVFFAAVLMATAGCSSARLKERKGERERVAASSRMFCEFISAEEHQDFDVELNLQMGRKCDVDRSFSVTAFRTPSDNQGLVYCCSLKNQGEVFEKPAAEKPVVEKPKAVEKPAVEKPVVVEKPAVEKTKAPAKPADTPATATPPAKPGQ